MVRVVWIRRCIALSLRDRGIEAEELGYSDTNGSEGEGGTKPSQEGSLWRV